MFSTLKAETSTARDEMRMSRSSLRIRCTLAMVVLALLAGSTVKTWSYLALKLAGLVRPQTSERSRGRRRLQTDGRDGVEILATWSVAALLIGGLLLRLRDAENSAPAGLLSTSREAAAVGCGPDALGRMS